MSEKDELENEQEHSPSSCFVISPIGDGDADIGAPEREIFEQSIEVYEEVILPACKAFGLEPVRADQLSRTGEIPDQVCRRLRDDVVVIADLTGGNPNVMYELGLRHTTGKLTIQLGEKGRLPFDVAAIRTIMFKRTQGGLIQARKRLSEVLSSGLSSGGDPVTATRVWLDQPPRHIAEFVQHENDEPGYLEKLVDLEEFIGGLSDNITKVAAIMDTMNELTTDAREQAEKLNARGAPASARLHLANKLAKELDPHAEQLREVAADFEIATQKVDPGIRYILSIPEGGPEEEAIATFRESLRGSLGPVAAYVESASRLRDQLSTTGEVTRSLRQVNGKTRFAIERLVKTSEKILEWGELLPSCS